MPGNFQNLPPATFALNALTPTRLCLNNPARRKLLIQSNAYGSAVLSVRSTDVSPKVIILGPYGSSVTLSYPEDATYVTAELFGLAVPDSAQVEVFETVEY